MKDFWDKRYAEEEYAYGTTPNDFLVAQKAHLRPGMSALSIGDGEGRNGVWLAEQGLAVTTVDYSREGVAKARRLARERGVEVHALCEDLTEWDWPEAAFDVVVAIFVHFPPHQRRAMHHAMLAALKPGGLLILEAYHKDQLDYGTGGPPSLEMLYTREELAEDFAGAEILGLEHKVREVHEGRHHHGTSSVLQLLARKPA